MHRRSWSAGRSALMSTYHGRNEDHRAPEAYMNHSVPDTETFVDALAVIMSWRRIGAFRASVRSCNGAGAEKRYTLEANTLRLTYTLWNLESGQVEHFDGEARTRSFGRSMETIHPGEFTPESVPARLAFPLSLLIWGRGVDNYRFTGKAQRTAMETRLELIHTRDETMRGTLTLDHRWRMLTALESPVDSLVYEDIATL